MIMRVEFYKAGDGRLCGWFATPPHRRPWLKGRRWRPGAICRTTCPSARSSTRSTFATASGLARSRRIVRQRARPTTDASGTRARSRPPCRTHGGRGNREWPLRCLAAETVDTRGPGTGRDVRPVAGAARR